MKGLNGLILPGGVEHLHGITYRVRLSIIRTADGGFDPKSTNLEFRNPRWTDIGGKRAGNGFSPEEMEGLRRAIQDHGLLHNITCRWFPYEDERKTSPKAVQLVDGERRFRSLSLLVNENPLCYNRHTKKMVPARDLYEWVECNITDMDDDEALATTVTGSDNAVKIGTGAQVGLVMHLQRCGKSDDEIRKICGKKSADWLCKTRKLGELASTDPKTYDALCRDQIRRSVARSLSSIADITERHRRLDLALRAADDRIHTLTVVLDEAEEEHEMAQAETAVAVAFGGDVGAHHVKEERARKRAKKARANLSRPRAGVTSGKDLESSGADLAKPFTTAKMEKYLVAPLVAIVKNKGIDPQTREPMDLDLDDAHLLVAFCKMLKTGVTGNPDTIAQCFLTAHKHKKNQRQAK